MDTLAASTHLILRRLGPDDLRPFQAYRQDPIVARFQSWNQMDDARARAFLEDAAGGRLLRPGHWSQIAIARASDNALMGDIGMFLSPDRTEAELGITLARDHQGHGHATTALDLACTLVFDRTGVARIVAGCDARHTASRALLTRVGFTPAGLTVVDGVTEANYLRPRPGPGFSP